MLPTAQPRLISEDQPSVLHFNESRSFVAKELVLSKPEKAGDDAWIVESLLDYDDTKYLVLWHGNEQSWQPYEDLFDCPDLVYQFWDDEATKGRKQPSQVKRELKEMYDYNQSADSDNSSESDVAVLNRKRRRLSSDEELDLKPTRKSYRQHSKTAYEESSSVESLHSDYSEESARAYHKRKRNNAKKNEKEPEFQVEEILTWRLEDDNTKSFACKLEDTSYHDIKWISESELSEISTAKYRNFTRNPAKYTDPPLPLSDTFDPTYLNVSKVMTVEQDELLNDEPITFYMIKWENLSYLYKTFESNVDHLFNFQPALNRYYLSLECAKMSPKSPPKKRQFTPFLQQPDYIPSPLQLKPHQLSGLNRMLSNWQQKKPLILADEMGLGKTIQTIIMIQYLFHTHQLFPHVIIVPNSTLDNWEREFHLWAPELSVLQFSGDREDRESAKSYECFDDNNKLRFHCLITTYSTTRLELPFIKHCGPFASLVVDESHNLKNERSLLYQCVDAIQVDFKLFLTGTPVQNKIRELFALLNFLDPVEFNDINALEEQYSVLSPDLVISLIKRLKPYILRRTVGHIANELPPKREVVINCGLTALQKQLYKSVIDKNLGLLAALDHSKKGPRTDIFMQLMRISMHPYAVDADIEPRNLPQDEELRLLISSSGKYSILMQILDELHKDKSKVIIFAQHKRTLDILQDILFYKHYNYFRMDGDTKRQMRQSMFDRFNTDPNEFAFIMTTRCGSEGINLTAASTVILMDMDFNPTVDKQAIGRCYRIGQLNTVLAIKLVTTNTVDERRLEIATRKSTLNRLLVKPLDSEQDLKSNDIELMIKHGAKKLFESDVDDAHIKLTKEELREYLDRSKASKTEEIDAEDDAFADGSGEMVNTIGKLEEIVPVEAAVADDAFWKELIRAKMKEEEIRNAQVQLGRGLRKRRDVQMVDFIQESDRNKDEDFIMQSSSDVDEEEMMVGDLMVQGDIENVNRGDAMTRLLQGVQQHRECLQKMGLHRKEVAIGIRCWLCNGHYHHLLSCPVIRNVGALRMKMEEFKNKPHLRKMVERVLMIATG